MFYVYVIQSLKDGKFYTGYTSDLNCRVDEHNRGFVKSTKNRRPFDLVYYEHGGSKEDAIKRERSLKSGRGKHYIQTRLSNYLKGKDTGSGLAPNQNY